MVLEVYHLCYRKVTANAMINYVLGFGKSCLVSVCEDDVSVGWSQPSSCLVYIAAPTSLKKRNDTSASEDIADMMGEI